MPQNMSEELKARSRITVLTINKLIELVGNRVTVNGFKIITVKEQQIPVMKIAERNIGFWCSGVELMNNFIPHLYSVFDTAEAIDNFFKASPQILELGNVITLPSGKKYRPVQFLGEVPKDISSLVEADEED